MSKKSMIVACAFGIGLAGGSVSALAAPDVATSEAPVADQCVAREGEAGTWLRNGNKWVKCREVGRAEPKVGGGSNFLPFLALPVTAGTIAASTRAQGRPFSP